MRAVILRPLINEKSMALIKHNFYTFEVGGGVNKNMVEREVKARFGVAPLSVNIVNLPKKAKMQRARRRYYFVQGTKKALIKLPKGQKIALFEVSEPAREVEIRTVEGETVGKTKEKKVSKGSKAEMKPQERAGAQDVGRGAPKPKRKTKKGGKK